jgi:hypothetical protein
MDEKEMVLFCITLLYIYDEYTQNVARLHQNLLGGVFSPPGSPVYYFS